MTILFINLLADRELIMGDIFLRGKAGADVNVNDLRPEITRALADIPLSPEPHWTKIVYAQNGNDTPTVAVTIMIGIA